MPADMPSVPNVPAAVPIVPAAKPGETGSVAPVAKPGEVQKAVVTDKEVAAAVQKIKFGGAEYSEKELNDLIEKGRGADKKFLEAAQTRKEALRFFKMAKENPTEFLRKTGLDPKKYAYDQVAEDLKNQLRDPKEVELESAQKRLKDYEAKEEAEKKRLEEVEQGKKATAWQAKLNQDIIEALDATPSIPKNGFTVAKIAKYMATVHAKTGVLLSPKEVVGVIEKDLRGELTGVIKGASFDQLIALVGEEGLATLRKGDMERLKDPLKGAKGPDGQPLTGTQETRQKRYKNSHEYWRSMDDAAKAEREARGGR